MIKHFIHRNEKFNCLHCGHKNPILKGSCRNHCTKCLYSLHLDLKTPGDRQSECRGLMEPVHLEKSTKKGYILVHKCQKCGEIKRNKSAEDDNFDQLLKVVEKSTK